MGFVRQPTQPQWELERSYLKTAFIGMLNRWKTALYLESNMILILFYYRPLNAVGSPTVAVSVSLVTTKRDSS